MNYEPRERIGGEEAAPPRRGTEVDETTTCPGS
jgi:hypothetical protein